jgi:hypothetical protein
MSELATLSLFLLSVAAAIAAFTLVARRTISAIRASKTLFAEATFKKNAESKQLY